MKRLLALTFTALLAACGGGTSSQPQSDPYVAALQAWFDSRPAWGARSGKACVDGPAHPSLNKELTAYHRLGVLSAPTVHKTESFGLETCWTITWPASATLDRKITNNPVVIGKYVVDKVGAEQTGAMDVKYRTYNAHFVPTEWGSKIITAGLATPAPAITDAEADFHTDPDGHLVVSE